MKKSNLSTGNGAHYLKIGLLTTFIVFAIVIYWLNQMIIFQVRKYETGEVVYQRRMQLGETFTLEYIHSVTAQPVYEVFFVKDQNTLALKEMRYDSFGSNLPAGSEKLRDEETKFIVEKGYYKILYENRTFQKVPLRIGQVIADHTLVFEDGERLRFLDLVEGGTYIEYDVSSWLEAFYRKGLRYWIEKTIK